MFVTITTDLNSNLFFYVEMYSNLGMIVNNRLIIYVC